MKIAAYQFEVTGNIRSNLSVIEQAITMAKKQEVNLVIFPECCLTGYPPRDMECSEMVDFNEVEKSCNKIQELANETDINIIVGTIFRDKGQIVNRAICIQPNQERTLYDKRALYGWDSDNFEVGDKQGIFEIQGIKIGVRICFEIRFPEYFRELYRERTDINVVLFYDVSDEDNIQRYEMIKGHIQTRAVENVTTTISVNTIIPYQTAPTAVFDKSGVIRQECIRGREEMLVYEFNQSKDDFGEAGRRIISDQLI